MQSADERTIRLVNQIAPQVFRLVWSNHLEPVKRASFYNDLKAMLAKAIVRIFEDEQAIPTSSEERAVATAFLDLLIGRLLTAATTLRPFDDSTFEAFANHIVETRRSSVFSELFAIQFDAWTSRIAKLQHSLVSSLRTISEEYVIWLKSHPDALDKIHWHAFERLTAEVLASHGFMVQLTARIRNRSSDIFAVETNTLGIQTKYVVECKRYREGNKVDVDIVNAVLGAKAVAHVDHAMLVTTSSFTRDVVQRKAELAELRLHLADGAKFREWLNNYELTENGLWLPEDWDMS